VKRWAPTLVQEEGLNDAPCPDLILGCASHTLRGAPAREPWKLPPLGATFKPPGHPGPACRKTRLAPRRPLQCDPLDARHLASGLPLATALLDFPPGSRTKPHRTRRLCSLGAWVVAHHISLRLVRRCFPPLRCPSAPCFATRWMSSQPFPRLSTPMSRRHWFWRESTRGQGMVRRCSQIKCRVCVKAAHPLLPRPIKAAWVGGRYPEAHNLSAAHFAARPLGMLRPRESRRRFWPWLCPYIQKQCCQPVFLCTASRPGT
jgi:hypothetical protein